MKTLLSAICILCSLHAVYAQSDSTKWNVNQPPGLLDTITITTDEGTWLNVDVSPDGKTIAFDLLGDIFTMPVTGGKATALRTGLAWEVQPRWSPDGRQLLFTSDAGGADNIWRMDADGEDAVQITTEDFRLLNNAVWMPSGDYFVARKHYTSERSLGAGEMWMYHISGGSGIQLTKRKNDQQDVNEPCVSPDGRYVYYSEDMYPGGFFQYNKDPNKQIYVIKRYDREKGTIEQVVGGPGGACRPQISNDGKFLAYVRRVRTQSVLFVRDLASGQDYPIYWDLDKDQQEAWAVFGVYTGFDWMADDQHIVIWAGGKIQKIAVSTGEASIIPMQVEVKHHMAQTVQVTNEVSPKTFEPKVLRDVVTSPDDKTIVFNALGQLYQVSTAALGTKDANPKRLTNDQVLEYEPAFSPDGSKVVYVTWSDADLGSIRTVDLNSGRVAVISTEKGIYRTPRFSPDGQTIVYRKEQGNTHQGYSYVQQTGIYTVPATGGKPAFVCAEGEAPSFDPSGTRIFYQTGGFLFGSLSKSLKSIDLRGQDEKKYFDTKYSTYFTPSPDHKWIAFVDLYKVYIAAMPLPGQPIGLSPDTKAFPVAQVAKDAGINLHWSADSKVLHWTLGSEYYSESVTDRFLFLEGSADSIPPLDTTGRAITWQVATDMPEGSTAITGATIITMDGELVIDKGTIVIEANRIVAVGADGTVDIPTSAFVMDGSGKTIMPGIIDVHAHLGAFRAGLSPEQHWQYYANLAYGVTTTHDPSVNTEITFAQSEMVKAGKMVGPRIYSTGTILYGAEGDFKAVINNLEDAKSALRRTKAYGAFSVKSYNQPRREQRQQVIEAARQLDMMVVPEGGSFFYHNMSMIADGHTGVEHNIPVAPLYDDVVQFWSATETHNTPTLIVNYGGVNGEYYYYQKENIWEKERLLAFTPRAIVDSRARHRTMVPDEEYENGHILVSQSCTRLQNAGVDINLGAHGQLQGLGAHWELWMLAAGGMTNMQALRAATVNGADYLGMLQDIGSLEVGKLADLIILDANPLEDIRHTEQVSYTMINGRLYDARTMKEVGNYDKERLPFYWEVAGSGNAYPFYEETMSFMPSMCRCRH